ncbi:MAG TPA: hypothetical protein DCZ95_12540 [Verrucomicrobia bacterium]|nr:hypothetical protein [Verrucomicrobiota bacterium]
MGYNVPDTNWHTYIFQFTAGSSNNGTIRLWVDGELIYENSTIDYASNTLSGDYFPLLQGNLSGGYNGPGLETYWDDYVWATTKAEVDSYMGEEFTPTCSDGTQNGTETGIDCGGSCDPCEAPLVCDTTHFNLCLTEGTCTDAGGYWCSEACQSSPCPISGAYPTLRGVTRCDGCR